MVLQNGVWLAWLRSFNGNCCGNLIFRVCVIFSLVVEFQPRGFGVGGLCTAWLVCQNEEGGERNYYIRFNINGRSWA
jgi:hypothetical protein